VSDQAQLQDAEGRAAEAARPAPSGASDGLVLHNVSRVFPGGVVAVDDVNLEVQNGEYVVFLGPSGCGKTTTLRMIGGHDEPSQGTIHMDGELLNNVPPAKRPVTTVFQHFALFPHRNVLQNVAFGLKMRGVDKKSREQQASDAIEMVGLGTMKQRKPRELSSGQQQRVALARVLVTRPKAILLDEPFGDLDRLLQLRMRVELRSLQRDLGITFIHVTHNQEEALSMSDRIVVMEGGRIQQVGTPTDLSRHPKNVFVARFMGDNNTIRGPVESSEGGVVTIVGEQAKMRVPGTATVGSEAAAAVRASAVKVSTDVNVPDVNGARARLNFAEYLGDSVKLHLDVAGQPFLAKVDEHRYAELAKAEGSDVTVTWDAADAQLLEL
jgi:ABC-type Fe3+/spermidine/putrescine transport system ATPase subunit